jgi:P27 family predicted phage terminase small subunit
MAGGRRQSGAINRLAESDDVNSGLTILTSNGNVIQNPLIGIANKAKTAVVRFAAEFGMTPSARSRVSVTPQEKDAEENKAARHF